jgi:hypothetical protein
MVKSVDGLRAGRFNRWSRNLSGVEKQSSAPSNRPLLMAFRTSVRIPLTNTHVFPTTIVRLRVVSVHLR